MAPSLVAMQVTLCQTHGSAKILRTRVSIAAKPTVYSPDPDLVADYNPFTNLRRKNYRLNDEVGNTLNVKKSEEREEREK